MSPLKKSFENAFVVSCGCVFLLVEKIAIKPLKTRKVFWYHETRTNVSVFMHRSILIISKKQ